MNKTTDISKYRPRFTVYTMAKQLNVATHFVIDRLAELGIKKSKPTNVVTPEERHHAYQYIKNNLYSDPIQEEDSEATGSSDRDNLELSDEAVSGQYLALHAVIKKHTKNGSPINTSELREAIEGIPPHRFIEDINCMEEMTKYQSAIDPQATLLREAFSKIGHDVDFGHRGWLNYNGMSKPRSQVDIEVAFVTASTLSQKDINDLARIYPEMAYALLLSLSKAKIERGISVDDFPPDHFS